MKAVISTGSKQYIVEPYQILDVELIGETGSKEIIWPALLLIDGENIKIGQPQVEGVKVTAEILGEIKGEKIKVLHFKAKKRVSKLTGHRQRYSQVKITKIIV